MEKRLTYLEISKRYESVIRPFIVQAIHACLNASDNPLNRYELIQCIVVATLKDLLTAYKTFNPEREEADFLREWSNNFIAKIEQRSRQQKTINALKPPS